MFYFLFLFLDFSESNKLLLECADSFGGAVLRVFLPLSDSIRLFKLDCDEELKLCMIRMFECDDNENRLSGYAGRVHHLNDCSNEMN